MLDSLYHNALAEQTSDFDPSGSSGGAGHSSHAGSGGSGSPSGDAASNTGESVSQTSDDTSQSACFKDSEHLDTRSKEDLLAETFPTLRKDAVVRILRKCGDNLSKATDELLNHVYLADVADSPTEELPVPRGIDAFAEEHHVPTRKRGKGKKKQKYHVRRASASEPAVSTPPDNHWENGSQHIGFIASRTGRSKAAISSLYHKNGASVPPTILALVDSNKSDEETDPALIEDAIALNGEFTNLDFGLAIALLRLTSGSVVYANDLAKALTGQPEAAARAREGIGRVVPQYAPIELSEPTSEWEVVSPSLPPYAHSRTSASLSAARSAAFEQASAAYRKGKSAPLMRGAAGYYSQVARDLNANLKVMKESDADALVNSQSTPTRLDLHGVSVQSATRIAREKTWAWWESLGETRIPGGGRAGVGQGFYIITGQGRHSEGGRSRITPAVFKTLNNEGWKIEVGSGGLYVLGRTKKK